MGENTGRYRMWTDEAGNIRFEKFQTQKDLNREQERIEQARAEYRQARERFEQARRAQGWERMRERVGSGFFRFNTTSSRWRNQRFAAEPGAFTEESLAKVFRTLAKKWHPDVGGTTEAQQALNEAHAELKKLFAQS